MQSRRATAAECVRRELSSVFTSNYEYHAQICVQVMTTLPGFACPSIGAALLTMLFLDLARSVSDVVKLGVSHSAQGALLASAGALLHSGFVPITGTTSLRGEVAELVARLLVRHRPENDCAHSAPQLVSKTTGHALDDSGSSARTDVLHHVERKSLGLTSHTSPPAQGISLSKSSKADLVALKQAHETDRPPSRAIAKALIESLRSEYTCLPRSSAALQTAVGATERLSGELYRHAAHFVYELVQNCDDASFLSDVTPQISFRISDDAHSLSVESNELGFSFRDVRSVCCSGASSKSVAHGHAHTGYKGIGFKSVFSVSQCPEIHSGHVHMAFDTTGELGALGMLAPTWKDPQAIHGATRDAEECFHAGTTIVLPLRHDGFGIVLSAAKVIDSIRDISKQPDMLLFLRRLVSSACVENFRSQFRHFSFCLSEAGYPGV